MSDAEVALIHEIEEERRQVKIASGVLLTLLVLASVLLCVIEFRAFLAFKRIFEELNIELPAITILVLQMQFHWFAPILGLAAVIKEPLIRRPHIRLVINAGLFVLLAGQWMLFQLAYIQPLVLIVKDLSEP